MKTTKRQRLYCNEVHPTLAETCVKRLDHTGVHALMATGGKNGATWKRDDLQEASRWALNDSRS